MSEITPENVQEKMNEELEQMQKQLAPVLQNIQENKVTNAPK